MALSPMMKQYFEIKEKYNDCILMFRLGDFYEMFFDDARTASEELELVLTGRDCGTTERAPMCGVPFHSAEVYISKLIFKGYRVAICEQLENPGDTKGIVKRDVIRVISPGTVIEGGYLNDERNNFICSLYAAKDGYGVVFADISTGEVHATDLADIQGEGALFAEAAGFSPAEIIVNKSVSDSVKSYFAEKFSAMITPADESAYNPNAVTSGISQQFGDGEIDPSLKCAYALNALLTFLKNTQKTDISYINNVTLYKTDKYLKLDVNTRRNLEICENMRTGEKRGSLLWVLDNTKTSAGTRLLRKWVEKPLLDVREIRLRQEAIRELSGDSVRRSDIGDLLRKTVDLERLLTRLVYGTANARDLLSLKNTALALPPLKQEIKAFSTSLMEVICDNLDTLDDIAKTIEKMIDDNPPVTLREGGIIKDGASESVDELRIMMKEGKNFIAKIEQTEKERTGIRTLKIGYNKIFGYYIEVSKSFMDKVPAHYIRRQTLANCERYVTEELKDMESKVISAKDRDIALEYDLFGEVREHILKSKERIQKTASLLALIDTLASLAETAAQNGYICPEVDLSDKIEIKDGRHPVVERVTKDTYFVPNDCHMDCGTNRVMLITGPNMAGKSTFMRQVALTVIMAQIGSFVPAASARIGICDGVFSRIGASDDLVGGDSTFMLEMKEVAYILANATKKSLVIYDEIGRGTSTYDGMSIARAVVEYTAARVGAKTLFATHYHNLISLEDGKNGIINYNIAAKKRGGEIVFLRKIVRGGTDDSYGIEVASLAGVPAEVLNKAKKILKELEEETPVQKYAQTDDISIGSAMVESTLEKLKSIDINTLSPIEALGILFEIKNQCL